MALRLPRVSALFALLLVSSLSVASCQVCDNPVFQNPSEWGATASMALNGVQLAAAPVPALSEPAACKHFSKEAGAELSCCTEETIKNISAWFTLAQEAMALAEKEIADNQFTTGLVKILQDATRTACGDLPCPDGIEDTLTKYIKILADASVSVQEAQVGCAAGLLSYTEGMICFACETNWQKFLNNATKVFNLAQDTCDSVLTSCQPVFDASYNVAIQSQNFVKELEKEITGFFVPIDIGKLPDMCGGTLAKPGDCSQFWCYNMLNGVGVPPMSWKPEELLHPKRALMAGMSEMTGMNEMTDMSDHMATAAEGLALQTHERILSAVHQNLVSPTLRAARVLSSASTAAVTAPSEASEGSHNSYSSSGGYDAYAAGCADLPCEVVPGSDSKFPGWAVSLIVAAGLLAGVAAIVVVRRSRRNLASGYVGL